VAAIASNAGMDVRFIIYSPWQVRSISVRCAYNFI
jgi:hypothetical protein